MVNSGSFDSDGDRNGKARCTQASDAATGSQSSDFGDAAGTTCKNDCSKSADTDLPSDSTAIEPTPSKTEINSSMPTEASSKNICPSNDEKASLCCSLPLEKIQSALTSCSPPPDNPITEDKLKRTRKLLCLYCDRSFVSVNLRQKHVERAHTVKPTRRVSARRQNQLSVTTCVHCDKLNASEHTLNDLFQHFVQEHPTKYFGCVSCEERFLTSTHLLDHNSSNHRIDEKINIKQHSPTALQIEEIDVDSLQDTDDVPLKVTRSKLRNKTDDPLNVVINSNLQKRKKKSKLKELRSKKISVKTSKIALKRSKRLQAQTKEGDQQKKRREKKLVQANKSEASNSTKQPEKLKPICVNPYPEFDNFYRVKKITDHSIDNLKISSLTFDDVFDKAFFNRIKCNIEENLLHHIDGKLFKNEESESRISNFEKISANPQEIQTSTSENYGCELSLNAITPVPSLSLNSQFGEDFESQIEYGAKPSKKKTQTKSDEVHYKYFTRRKYQASILQQKENRDLSKLDMWTQMVVKERQEKVLNKKKNAKEIQEYTSGHEYKNKMKREELNRILDRRGPFEDLKEEASKKAAFDKLNSSSDSDISQEVFTDVRAVLNEILNKVFEAINEDDCLPEISSIEIDHREIPAYLDLRRKDSSTQEEIDKSDRIALICSSQETENYELPTNTVRGKHELIELTGEWARSRMYICAACGSKFSNMKYLLEHRSIYHQNVWVQNYEFVGNQSELYRHLSIPGLGKVGVVEDTVPCKQWKRSDARMCTKCGKQCNSLGELHRHVLECGGDWTWMLARKKCKYRPFGAKSRRKRRGLVPRIHNKRKTEPSEKKNYKKPLDGPRQRPSDADTIQRMLANLPAKRSRRSLISLRDVVFKSRKTKPGNNTQTTKVKCGKTVCKKQKTENNKKPNISQQRNSRSLRSLNKVLSSRILDLNSSLMVKRKLKVIRGQRSTQSNLKLRSNISETSLKEIENESFVDSDTESSKKRKSPKRYSNNSEDSKTVTRISLSDKKNTLTKKMLTSRLNIKSFFPVKKKSVPLTKKISVLDQADDADNSENETDTKKSIYLENSRNMKKNKRGGLKGFVRALSLRKRNSKHEESAEKTVTLNSDMTDTVESNSTSITKKVGRPKTKKISSLDKLDKLSITTEPDNGHVNVDKGLSKKRKLQRTFRNVINKVKKSKTEKISQKSDQVASVKTLSKETKTQSFLEGKTLHKAIPPEKVTASAEVKENIQEKEDHVPIAANFSDPREYSSIPEIIINESTDSCYINNRLQANNELHCGNEQTNITHNISVQESISVTEEDLPLKINESSVLDNDNKSAPVTIDTTLKSKCAPLVSPNIKGKIRKPNRGLNDCIAMLTNKLQQKDEKISSSLESLFSTSSTTSMERTESRLLTESISPPVRHQKTECILKIPTFRASKSPVVKIETALDLSKKSFSSPNLLFPHSSDVGYLESTINKVIEGVIEHKCKEVLTEKFAAPTWTSVDDIIQQVVQSSSSTIFDKPSKKKSTFNIRTNVDDTIDCVINSSSNWFEIKCNSFEEKRKLSRKLRRRKNSDDNLIKDIIFGKDKLLIAPSSTLHNALENSLIAKIKENESKISATSNTVHEHIDKDLEYSLTDSSVSDPKKDQVESFSVPKEKFNSQESEQSHQTQIINEPNGGGDISLQTLVKTDRIISKTPSVDNDFIVDNKETESENESYSQDKSTKVRIENMPKDVNLHLVNLVKDKSKSSNINGSLVVKTNENESFPNNNILQAIETPKNGKAKRKGRGRKGQKQNQPELTTKPVIETCTDDCLNVKLSSTVELKPPINDVSIENSNLDCGSLIKQQTELITESVPLILENKVVEQSSKSLLSDSEDEVPLAIIAKQEENHLQKHSSCQNGNVLQILKNAQETSDLKDLQDNETTKESLNVITPLPKLLEEAILDNEQNNSLSNSCNSLNLNKDIVENLTTDSLKENIEQVVNQNANQQHYVCNPKAKPLKTKRIIRPMKRKRRKIVFGNKKPSSNKKKNEFDSLDAENEQSRHLDPISPYTASITLDTRKINSLKARTSELSEEDQSDLPQETEICNELISPSNVSAESVKSQSRTTEINEPVKMLINSQRTRRKSKSSKKIDKFDNDLFKDFSLVINKKTKRIPPTSIVDDSVCDDVLDRSIDMPVKSGEIDKTSEEANEPPLIDSVEEMDMEIEDIPINTSIIERDNQPVITVMPCEEKSSILVAKVNSQRPGSPNNEMENVTAKKWPRKKSIPDSSKTIPFCGEQIVENNKESINLTVCVNYCGSRRGRKNKIDNTETRSLTDNFSVHVLEESSQKERIIDNKLITAHELVSTKLKNTSGQQLVSEAEDTTRISNNTANTSTERIEKNEVFSKEERLEGTEESIGLSIIHGVQENFLLIDQKQTLSTQSREDSITNNVVLKISNLPTENSLRKKREPKGNLKQAENFLQTKKSFADEKVGRKVNSILLVSTSTPKRNKKGTYKNKSAGSIKPSTDLNVLSGKINRDRPKKTEYKDSLHCSSKTDGPKTNDVLENAVEECLPEKKDFKKDKDSKKATTELSTDKTDFHAQSNSLLEGLTSIRSKIKSRNKELTEGCKELSQYQTVLESTDMEGDCENKSETNNFITMSVSNRSNSTERAIHENVQFIQSESPSKILVLESNKATLQEDNLNTDSMGFYENSFEESIPKKRLQRKAKFKNSVKKCEGSVEISTFQTILLTEDISLTEILDVENDLNSNDEYLSDILKVENNIQPTIQDFTFKTREPKDTKNNSNTSGGNNTSMHSETFNHSDRTLSEILVAHYNADSKRILGTSCLDVVDKPSGTSTPKKRSDKNKKKLSDESTDLSNDQTIINEEDKSSSTTLKAENTNKDALKHIDSSINSTGMFKESKHNKNKLGISKKVDEQCKEDIAQYKHQDELSTNKAFSEKLNMENIKKTAGANNDLNNKFIDVTKKSLGKSLTKRTISRISKNVTNSFTDTAEEIDISFSEVKEIEEIDELIKDSFKQHQEETLSKTKTSRKTRSSENISECMVKSEQKTSSSLENTASCTDIFQKSTSKKEGLKQPKNTLECAVLPTHETVLNPKETCSFRILERQTNNKGSFENNVGESLNVFKLVKEPRVNKRSRKSKEREKESKGKELSTPQSASCSQNSSKNENTLKSESNLEEFVCKKDIGRSSRLKNKEKLLLEVKELNTQNSALVISAEHTSSEAMLENNYVDSIDDSHNKKQYELQYNSKFFDTIGADNTHLPSEIDSNIEDSGFLEKSSEESPYKKKIGRGSEPDVKHAKTLFQENVQPVRNQFDMSLQNEPNTEECIFDSTRDIIKPLEKNSGKITKECEDQEEIYRTMSSNFKLSECNNDFSESVDISEPSSILKIEPSNVLENKLLTAESGNITDALPVIKQLEIKEICKTVCEVLPLSKKTKRGSKDNKKQLKSLRKDISKNTINLDVSITDNSSISLKAQSELSTAVETPIKSLRTVKRRRKSKKQQEQLNQNSFDRIPSCMENTISETKSTEGSLLPADDLLKVSGTGTEEFVGQTDADKSEFNLNDPQTDGQLLTRNNENCSDTLEQFWNDTSLFSLRRSGRNRSITKLSEVASTQLNLVPDEIDSKDLDKYQSNKICVESDKTDKQGGFENFFQSSFATSGNSNAGLVAEPTTKLHSYCLGLGETEETSKIDDQAECSKSDKLKNTSEDSLSELSKLNSEITPKLYISKNSKNLKCDFDITSDLGKSRRSRKNINYNEENLEKRATRVAIFAESRETMDHPKIEINLNSVKKNKKIQKNLSFSKKNLNDSVIEEELEDSITNIFVDGNKQDKESSISRSNVILCEDYSLEQTTIMNVNVKTPVKSDKKQRRNVKHSDQNFTGDPTLGKDENGAAKCSHTENNTICKHKVNCSNQNKEIDSQNTLNTEQLEATVSRIADFSEIPKLVIDLELMDKEYEEPPAYSNENLNMLCENLMESTESSEKLLNSSPDKCLNDKDILGVPLVQETTKYKVSDEFGNPEPTARWSGTSSKIINVNRSEMGDLYKSDTDKSTKSLNIFEFEESIPTEQDIEYKKSTKKLENTRSLPELSKQLETHVSAVFSDKYENSCRKPFLGRDRRSRKNVNYDEEKWENIIESSKPVELISTQDLNIVNIEGLSSNVKNNKKHVTSKNQKLPNCSEGLESVESVETIKATEFLSLQEAETTQTPSELPLSMRQTRKSRKNINYEENLVNLIVANTVMDTGCGKNIFDINNDTIAFNSNTLGEKSKKQKIPETLNLSSEELLNIDNSAGLKKVQESQSLEGSRETQKKMGSQIAIKRGRKQNKNIDLIEETDTIESSCAQPETDEMPNIFDLKEPVTVQSTLINELDESNLAEINCNTEATPNNKQIVKQLLEPQIPLTSISDSSFLPVDNVEKNMFKTPDICTKEIFEVGDVSGLTDTYIEESRIYKEISKLKKPRKNIMDIDVANILDTEGGSENRRSPRKKRSLKHEKQVKLMEQNIEQTQSHIGTLKNELIENKSCLWDTETNVKTASLEDSKSNLTEAAEIKVSDESKTQSENLEPFHDDTNSNSSDSNESIPLLDRMTHFFKNLKNKSDTCNISNTDSFIQSSNSITECVRDYVSNSKYSLPIISVSTTDEVFKNAEISNQKCIDKSVHVETLLPLTKSNSMDDLILENKSATKAIQSKSSDKKRKGKRKNINENPTNICQNEILAESVTIVNSNDGSRTEESFPKSPDQKYELAKINIKSLLLSSLAAPKSKNLKTDTFFKSKGKRVKGKKNKSGASSQNVFEIFDKTVHESSSVKKPKNKYTLGKNLNFTALKQAISTIAKPGKKNKQKKTEVMFSEIKPLTDIITSSEMDIAPVLDEIDKSLESEDIYDFNEEEISTQSVTARNKETTKTRSRSCPKPHIRRSNLLNNEICPNVEQQEELLKEPTRINSKRSAKLKALENIHEKAIAELNYLVPKPALDTRSRKSRRRSKSLNASKEDEIGNEDAESKNCNEKSDSTSTGTINNLFSCQEGIDNNSDVEQNQTDLLGEFKGAKNEDCLFAKAGEKSSEENIILEQVLTQNDDFIVHNLEANKTKHVNQNNNSQEILESENPIETLSDCQELRRSRRGSRKVASYNENDLIDPLIDALENRRNRSTKKERSEDKHPVKKDDAYNVPTEKPKLNSEELFDLLKNSSYDNEHLNILKPRNSFLENLNEPNSNTDFAEMIDDEFDNILEKPALILTSTEKLKDMDKIYEFTDDTPENTKQVKDFGVNKRKLPTNQENVSGETRMNSVCNNSVENSLGSYASKEKDVEPEKSNYCEICKKTFTRMENLIKHKTTLTHISKLSELEAKEAEERARLENEKQSIEKSSDLLLKTSDSLRDEINIRDILQQSERTQSTNTPKNTTSLTNNHPLNLVDIISDVLNKPVLENFSSEKHSYAEITIQNIDSDVRRYKSLGERKSFESESQLSRISTPLSESYLPSAMSKTTILENQIHLLENIIGNKLESLAANKAQSDNKFIEEVSSCSNNSNLSAIDNNSCASNRSAFNLNSENIQANSHAGFIKPVQYEEISEDSASARVYEDSKPRKTLNRDEELFLECCSLLKSGSEVSNSNYSKNLKKPLGHFKESDELELLENKKLTQTVEEAHEYSDNSRTPTPLGDTYDDEASNSNTISSNWNLKSERPLDKNRSFSFEEVVNKEESGISFGEILTKGLRNQFEYMPKSDERTNEELQEDLPSRSLVLDDRKDDSDCSSTSKKISTKGARKVFEGLKVSIPTEDLNLDVLNNSLINKKSELQNTSPFDENQATIHNKPRSTRKSKPVKKSQVGSNLLFKVNKKKTSTHTNTALHKKQDIYNFEETTQDNTDVFSKPLFKDVKIITPEDKERITALDSDNESLGFADSIGADAKSVSSVSSISAMSSKKPEATPENITKKKYKIMGKIFRNAAKYKMDEIDEEHRNIPEIPEIDNLELVKNYVRSCQKIKSPFLPPPPPPPLDEVPKKPKMTEEEMSLLFDQLLGKEVNELKSKSMSKISLAKCRTDSKTGDVKKKINKIKIRKRARANSESSDDEFNINKTAKKRANKKNNQEDSGINLELELKECIGVASRKSQRKCTSGKQNVLVEHWSSDEEVFEAMLNSQIVQVEKEKTEHKKSVVKESPEKKPHNETAIPTEKSVKPKPAKRKPQPSKKLKTLSNKNSETGGMASTASNRRKRAAANPLYHWSSSSEDESQSLIEVKPVREEDDEEDRPVQHGWIVGDSPKKLVTMLALTKGKKTDIDSVKEQGKRRTSNTVS